MPETFTLYERLGVSRTASLAEIKSAYRANVAKYHPDVNSAPNSQIMMAMLNEAWQILSDPTRREQYDKSLDGVAQSRPESREATGAAGKRAAQRAAEAERNRAAREQAKRQAEEERLNRIAAEAIEHRQRVAEDAKRERQRIRIFGLGVVLAIASALLLPRISGFFSARTSAQEVSQSSPIASNAPAPSNSPRGADHLAAAPMPRGLVPLRNARPTGVVDLASPAPPARPVAAREERQIAKTIASFHGPEITITYAPTRPSPEQHATEVVNCSDQSIERVRGNGATVDTSSGVSYSIPDQGTMQIEVRSWSTGDNITVCTAGSSASIADHNNLDEKVQATNAGAMSASTVSCSDETIERVRNNGATVDVSNGASYDVPDQGTMQIEVRSWSTGDTITVCKAGLSASIADHNNLDEKVQVTYGRAVTAPIVTCSNQTIVRVGNNGTIVDTSNGASYSIPDQGTMQIEVRSWSTGDAVIVCNAGSSASITDHDNLDEKVQAIKL